MEKFIHMRDYSDGQENILGLDNPDLFDCRVHTYQLGHSILVIQLLDQRNMDIFEPQYVIFEPVQYFEGYVWWKGANLTIRQSEIFINPIETDNLVKHAVRMYAFLSGEITIKIWGSSSIYVTDTLPSMFRNVDAGS